MEAHERLSPIRRLVIGAVVLTLAGAGLAAGRTALRPSENVTQPIPFNHKKHVQGAELECATCHEHYETSASSGLPELATCLGCHDGTVTGTAEEKKLVELGKSDPPPRFLKLFCLPDHVYYSHRRHVGVAGLKCEQCHGAIAASTAPPSRPLLRITMDTCVACHATQGVQTDCGMPVEFVYPSVTSIVPANIALVAGSKSPEAGKRFIQFTLSDEGQALLLDKQISRLPVLPATYQKAPAGYPNPFTGKIQAKVNFDSNLSESRYFVVLALFDQLVTFRHKELAAATKAIHDAQRRLGGKASAQLDEARGLVFTPPIDEKQASDKALESTFKADKKDADASRRRAQVEEKRSAIFFAGLSEMAILASVFLTTFMLAPALRSSPRSSVIWATVRPPDRKDDDGVLVEHLADPLDLIRLLGSVHR